MPPKLPTDLELLNTIYQTYHQDFVSYSDENKTRSSKIWVPINIDQLALKLKNDPDLIFGRLYYHLNDKYGHANGDGTKREFFAIRIGANHHCVNFPYLASILASLKEQQKKFLATTTIAAASLLISLISIVIALNT